MSEVMLQMFANVTTSSDAAANIDIPDDGTITGVDWASDAVLNADGEGSAVELSFIATNQLSTNDARGVISLVRSVLGLLTSGAGITSVNKFVPMDLDVSGGERLYLHVSASSGVVTNVSCVLHFRPRRGLPRRSRRRT